MAEFLQTTHAELMDLARRLGDEEYDKRLNYFRIMEYPLALNLLQAQTGMAVLDIGSMFASLPPLWLATRGCTVTSLDKKPLTPELREYLDLMKKRAGIDPDLLTAVEGDAVQLPFPDDTFDRIVAISSLEHLELFTEAQVAVEMGRVLKPGGRAVFSFVFNLPRHIEHEQWGGKGYDQKHYSGFTLNERLIRPSRLHFCEAILFGEADSEIGRQYLAMSEDDKRTFAEQAGADPEKYWRTYHRLAGIDGRLVLRDALLPRWLFRSGGLIAAVLEKKDVPPDVLDADYDPIESYLANERLTRNEDNSPHWLTIDRATIADAQGDEARQFNAGDGCRIAIDFSTHGDPPSATFRVLFHNAKSKNVVAVVRREVELNDSASHRLLVDIDALNLVAGTYDVTIGAWDRAQPDPLPPVAYDVHLYRYRIEVQSSTGAEGVAHLPHSIRLDD